MFVRGNCTSANQIDMELSRWMAANKPYRRKQAGASIWQRSSWEHIIRGEDELNRTRHYTDDNPLRWLNDQGHPALN
jgi:hypothetical protein